MKKINNRASGDTTINTQPVKEKNETETVEIQEETVPMTVTEGKPLPDANPNGLPAPAGAP